MDIGRKSTLFLAYAYEFDPDGEKVLEGSEVWKKREIKGVALLPHLDEYVRKGELLRAYEVAGDLRAAFGGRDPWKLVGPDDASVEITITEPPRLYALDTRYAFIVIGVAPYVKSGALTLATMQDVSYALVRAGIARVAGTSPQMTKWIEGHELVAKEPPNLRRWLAALVPGLRAEAPRGSPRTTAPALFSVILAKEPLGSDDRHRLRLVHRSDQVVEPAGVADGDEPGEWKISNRELCLFSTFGVSWVVTTDETAQASHFLNDAPHMIRDRYVYKWLLVEHQRLCLLALNTECADMSKGIDGANFAEMRMRLLTFIATYNFRHVSNEERHDRFYKRVREAVSIDDLLAEVTEEVVEIDTQLAARRAELLNHVLAFLTLVLTPVGIMVGIFQSDTGPGPLRFPDFISATSWWHLITHPPFLAVLAAAATGATIYVRLFGVRVIANLFRQLIKRK